MDKSHSPAMISAIQFFGGTTQLAKTLGIRQSAISNWRRRNTSVPPEHAITIERESGGAVRCEDLRPDVDWAYLRGTAISPREASATPTNTESAAPTGQKPTPHLSSRSRKGPATATDGKAVGTDQGGEGEE